MSIFNKTSIFLAFAVFFTLGSAAFAQGPVLTMPADEETCVELDVMFEWTLVGSATEYAIEIATSSTFGSTIVDVETALGAGTFSYTSDQLSHGTVYYWRVTATLPGPVFEGSGTQSFTTKLAPPIAVNPETGDDCELEAITFEWTSSGTGATYDLQVASDNSFESLIHNETGLTNVTFAASGFQYNTTYYWKVRATKDGCTSDWSSPITFSTNVAPPILSGPADESSCELINVGFDWDAVGGGTIIRYQIQVSTGASSSFTDEIFIDQQNITNNYYNVKMPDYDDVYYWHVRAVVDGCATDWSPIWSFNVVKQAPTLTKPASSAKGVAFDQVFEWSVGEDAHSYDIQIAEDAAFEELVVNVAGHPSKTFTSGDFNIYNKELYWRVRANYSDCATDWTGSRKFKTYYQDPIPTNPPNFQECVALTSLFQWNQAQFAYKYRIQIATDVEFTAVEINQPDVQAIEYQAVLTKGNTDYFWRVRAEDEDNTGRWSEIRTFTTAPTPPEITAPEDGSTGHNINMLFEWEPYEGTGNKYDLQIADNTDFDEPLFNETNLNSHTFTATLPDYFKTYYWRIKGLAGQCPSAWSEPFEFMTGISPPELVSPMDNNIDNKLHPTEIIFSWTEPEGASYFEFALATDTEFKNNVPGAGQTGIPTTSKIVKNLEHSTCYYWRVRAFNEDGTNHSNWSEIWKVCTGGQVPEVPMLISPADKATAVPVNADLLWHMAARADQYNVEISYNPEFSDIFTRILAVEDTTVTVEGLPYSDTFYWRVNAESDSGLSKWSTAWSFRTAPIAPMDAPDLRTPSCGMSNAPVNVTFSWESVQYAESYELQLTLESNTFTLENLELHEQNYTGTTLYYGELKYDTTYRWRVRGFNDAGYGPWSEVCDFKTTATSVRDDFAARYNLRTVPNPFTDRTFIEFELSTPERAIIEVFNIRGQKMATLFDGTFSAGSHSIPWNAQQTENGVYMIVVKLGDKYDVKRIVLNK